MTEPSAARLHQYDRAVKNVSPFEGKRDVQSAKAFILELEGIRERFNDLFTGNHVTDKELLNASMRGDAKNWLCFYEYASWTKFTTDFELRWSETRDELVHRYTGLTFQKTDNAYAHAGQFSMLSKAIGYTDLRRVLDDFVASVADSALRTELRMRTPTTLEEASTMLHNLCMAVSTTPLPPHQAPPKVTPDTRPTPSTQKQDWDVTRHVQDLSRRMDQMTININRLLERDYQPNYAPRANNYNNGPRQYNNGARHAGASEDPAPRANNPSATRSNNTPTPDHGRTQLVAAIPEDDEGEIDCDTPVIGLSRSQDNKPFTFSPHKATHTTTPAPLIAPARRIPRIPIAPEVAGDAAPGGAPPVGPWRAGAPMQVMEAPVQAADLVARRAIARPVTLTVPELYAVGSPAFRQALQAEYNNMHTYAEEQAPRQLQISPPGLAVQINNALSPNIPEPLLEVSAYVNGRPCLIILDTGAQYNVMSMAAVYMLSMKLDAATVNFKGVDGIPQTSAGSVMGNVRLGDNDSVVAYQRFLVVDDRSPDSYTVLCGIPFLRALQMIIDVGQGTITVRKDKTTSLTLPLAGSAPAQTQTPAVGMVRSFSDDTSDGPVDPRTRPVTRPVSNYQPPTHATAPDHLMDMTPSPPASPATVLDSSSSDPPDTASDPTSEDLCDDAGEVPTHPVPYDPTEPTNYYNPPHIALLELELGAPSYLVPPSSPRNLYTPPPNPDPASSPHYSPLNYDTPPELLEFTPDMADLQEDPEEDVPTGFEDPTSWDDICEDTWELPPPTKLRLPHDPLTFGPRDAFTAATVSCVRTMYPDLLHTGLRPDKPHGWDNETKLLFDIGKVMAERKERLEEYYPPGDCPVPITTSTSPAPEDLLEPLHIPEFPQPVRIGKQTPAMWKQRAVELLTKYRAAFAITTDDLSKPANLPAHHIMLKPGSPIIREPYRRPAKGLELVERAMLEAHLAADIIEPSQSPYSSPLLFVPKSLEEGVDPKTLTPDQRYRAVTDFRRLNSYCDVPAYPAPNVHDVIEDVAAGVLFSRGDAKSAFLQLELAEESRHLTAFNTSLGSYQYKRVAMGLSGSPAAWAHGIDTTLRHLPDTRSYTDDMATFTGASTRGNTPEMCEKLTYMDHFVALEEWLVTLEKYNIRMSPHKCVLFAPAIRLLGYIIADGTISTDPAKTAAVDGLHPWKSYKDLERYLGFITYYGHAFIWQFSAKTKPLRDLKKRYNQPIGMGPQQSTDWGPKEQAAYELINQEIKQRTLRYRPDFEKPFIIATDFSCDGLAAVLSQEITAGQEVPISFISRATTPAERIMGSMEGELRAVQYALETLHYYVALHPFKLLTDSSAITHMLKHHGQNSKLGRLSYTLTTNYQFTIKHRPGKLNTNVDALSRSPVSPGVPEVISLTDDPMDSLVRPQPTPTTKYPRFADTDPVEAESDIRTLLFRLARSPSPGPSDSLPSYIPTPPSPFMTPMPQDPPLPPSRSPTPPLPPLPPPATAALSSAGGGPEPVYFIGTIGKAGPFGRANKGSKPGPSRVPVPEKSDSDEGDNDEQMYKRAQQAADNDDDIDNMLPVPRYCKVPEEMEEDDEGSPVSHAAKCSICHKDNHPSELLVCEMCKELCHTWCHPEVFPDGLLPDGPFYCMKCAPFEDSDSDSVALIGPKKTYLDIWFDLRALAAIRDGTDPKDWRAKHRARNYTWDHKNKQLRTSGTSGKQPRVVPPPAARTALAVAAHDSLGHRGHRSVSDALRTQYTWKGMENDVKNAVDKCNVCRAHKPLPDLKALATPGLRSIPQATILTRWTMDLLTMPYTNSHRYIAVAVESYSRTVVSTPINDKRSATVREWLKNNIFYVFGVPLELQCDQGGEFQGEVKDLCNTFGIKLTRGAPYHPQSQGLVERANRTLIKALAALTTHDPKAWPMFVPQAVFAMNACKQASTKFSPFFLLHGIQPSLPLDLGVKLDTKDPWHQLDHDAVKAAQLQERLNKLETAHPAAVTNLKNAQNRQARGYAKRTNQDLEPAPTIKPDDQVYTMLAKPKTKGGPAYEGPFIVVERYLPDPENQWLLKGGDNSVFPEHAHRILKKQEPSSEPSPAAAAPPTPAAKKVRKK